MCASMPHGDVVAVSAGSSEARKGGNTFLQLKLTVNNGEQAEDVYMGALMHACHHVLTRMAELTLPQFYTLLHELERAKASLASFTA